MRNLVASPSLPVRSRTRTGTRVASIGPVTTALSYGKSRGRVPLNRLPSSRSKLAALMAHADLSSLALFSDFWLWDDEKVASGWEPANGLFSPPASPAKRDGRNLGSAPTRPSASRTAASSPTASSRASTSRLFREDSSDDEDDDILIISPSTHSDAPKEERLTPELPPPSKLFKTSKGSGAIADLQYRLSQLERKVTALADDKAELKPENRGLKRKLAAASLGLQV